MSQLSQLRKKKWWWRRRRRMNWWIHSRFGHRRMQGSSLVPGKWIKMHPLHSDKKLKCILKLINHHKKDGYKLIIDGGDALNKCTAADIARLKEPSLILLLAYKTCLRLMGNEGHASFASCIQDVSVIFEGRDQPGHTLGDGLLLELEFPTTTGAVASPTRAASSKESSQPSPI